MLASLEAQRAPLEFAVRQVSHALRRLAEAASASLGADCYTHAELGRVLLADLGFTFETQVGFAAWRVGRGDSDVLSHVPNVQAYLPPGAGMGFAYHAWLEGNEWLVDFTTYQFRRKGQELDAADGGHTRVDWCPDYLLLSRHELRSYKEVAQAPGPGLAFYESNADLTSRMASSYSLDAEDVATARLILSNPDMMVLGPNMLKSQD
ncbi:hypothetical protein WJ87_07695 [Burkholderia ubonensis]|nr:hypothetical protein WJ87_07695 [Burkholderia ubonensis]